MSLYINNDQVTINDRNAYDQSYWELDCSSSSNLKSGDKISMKEGNSDVRTIWITGGYYQEPYSLDNENIFEKVMTFSSSEKISGGYVNENDYIFEGANLNGDNYTVELFKMPISSLDFSVTTSALTRIDSNSLKLESNEFSSMEKGWYGGTVKNNNSPVNGGFIDNITLPIAIDKISNEVDYPKVTLNGNISSTINSEIEVSIYSGDYESFRYSESQEDLSSKSWNNIETLFNYTLSEGFGSKTLFFEFKKSGLSNYNIQKTITYIDKDL